QLAQMPDHGWGATQPVGRPHEEFEAPKVFLFESESFADTSLDAVTLDGSGGVPAGDQHPEARLAFGAPPNIKKVAAQAAPLAFTQQLLKLRLAAQPATCIEPETLSRRRYNATARRAGGHARAGYATPRVRRACGCARGSHGGVRGASWTVGMCASWTVPMRKRAVLERAAERVVKSKKHAARAVDNPSPPR